MINLFARETISKYIAPIAKLLLRFGLSPNIVTVLGALISIIVVAVCFYNNWFIVGAVLLWAFASIDLLDGAMARAGGKVTKYGAVLDASCDRLVDGTIFAALAWWAAFRDMNSGLAVLLLLVLVFSNVISYIKAKSESLGLVVTGGLIERAERIIIILVGVVFLGFKLKSGFWIAVILLVVGSLITIGQRLWATYELGKQN